MQRVLIADDNQFLRDALKAVVFDRKDWVVCGEAVDGGQTVEMAAELKPDLILLDFQMPVMNSLAAAARMLETSPSVPIVLYTLHKNSTLECQAKSVGVRTVVSKGDVFTILVASLKEIFG